MGMVNKYLNEEFDVNPSFRVCTGIDGYLDIPSYPKCIAEMIFDMQINTDYPRTRIKPLYVNGKYSGFECVDFDISPTRNNGIYIIEYIHPITNVRKSYTGSTIHNFRNRLRKFIRIASTGNTSRKENGASALQWRNVLGSSFDYTTVAFYPLDKPQSFLRVGSNSVESHLIRMYEEEFPGSVMNRESITKKTLHKNKINREITPSLPF